MHQDAQTRGLYLRVTDAGTRAWIYRYMLDGKRRDMGLGPVELVSLAEARIAAADARRQVHRKIDPLAARDAERSSTRRVQAVRAWTFKRAAEEVHETLRPGWKNPKHADQWINSLAAYAFPKLGELPVGGVDVAAVVDVLRPIWVDKRETARRVRQRIDAVITWAIAHGYASTNPVDAAVALLPKVKKAVQHHEAVPVAGARAFWTALGKLEPFPATLALRFAILTAARSGEVRAATWSEIDLEVRLWTVPAERMKAGREHQVPLSDQAVAVLEVAAAQFGREAAALLFPGPRKGRPLSDNAFTALLGRMKVEATAHGFRSTFRDWCAETGVSRELAERALAHVVGDDVEAAYNRTALLEQRRPLMARWGAYLVNAKKVEEDANAG
jgi:integrase